MRCRFQSAQAVALAASVVATASLFAVPAAAQDPASKAQAVQLFDAADKLMLEGKIAAACPKYAASMKLDPQLGALLHLADCYAKNGQTASAWGSFREAEEMARMKGDDRAPYAKEQAAQLEPRLSHLTVTVPDSSHVQGLEVRIDGSPVAPGAWSMATPIDGGSHALEARAPGYESWSSRVVVTGDAQEVRVEIPLLTASAAPPPGGGQGGTPVNVQFDDSGSPIRTLGWVGIGVGAASLGLGAVFLVQKGSKLDERDRICPKLIDCPGGDADQRQIDSLTGDARSAQTMATTAFAVGGALVVGGIVAVIFAPKPRARTDSAWLLPAVSPQVLGLAGGMTW